MNLIPVKIFVSSPSDVNPERAAAQRVIERLGREFGGFFAVSAELWEQEPLRATSHFQDQIPRPSEADIVLVIVWSRLGTRLPSQNFKGMLSGGAVTGTEWEFEDAALSFRERGKPDLLFYRKTARIDVSLDDDDALKQRLDNKRRLDDFLQQWFFTESAEFKNAFTSFGTAIEFELIVEQHLRKLLQKRLETLEGAEAAEPARWQGGSPFRGLEPFDVEHAAIFYGRSRARMELREALAARAREGTAFVLLLGMSGSGKSSLVRAALVPDLGVPGMVEQVGLFRHAIFRPSDNAGGPLAALAEALFDKAALPELTANGWPAERIAQQLADAPESLGAIFAEALQIAGQSAGLLPGAKARLLLVIDQFEEIFTSPSISAETRAKFAEALYALARSEAVWIVATMRSDMFHHLGTTPRIAELAEGAGQYHLLPPQPAEIAQIIREPASAAGLRFEVDPDTNIGLDETLRAAMENDPAALPLLEFTLDELFHARTARGVLTYGAYKQLGGIEGALARRAEDIFEGLVVDAQAALPAVATALVVSQRGAGGGFAARRAPFSEFVADASRRALVEAFVTARLFVSDGGDGATGATVRVAHEALFRKWPRMSEILERNAAFVITRERLTVAKERWLGEGSPDDLLLPEGRALAEAEELLKTRPDDLDAALKAFIEASSAAARRRRNRSLRWAQGIAAGFAVIALIAGVAGWMAWRSRLVADAARVEAVHQRDGALKTESYFLAALSEKSTRARDAFDGVLLARAALPTDIARPDRPVVPEARDALAGAMENLGVQRGVVREAGPQAFAAFVNTHLIASFSKKDSLRLSRAPDGKALATIGEGVPDGVWFTKDAREFILLSRDTFRFTDGNGRETGSLSLSKPGDALFSESLNHNLTRAALLYATGDDRVIDLPSGREVTKFGAGKPVILAVWAGASSVLVWSDTAGHIVMQDTAKPGAGVPLPGQTSVVYALAATHAGDLVAGGGVDGRIRLWSVPDGRLRSAWVADKGPVTSLTFSLDGKRLISTGHDGSVRVWDVASSKRQLSVDKMPEHPAVALSPDGRFAAIAGADFAITVYDTTSGKDVEQLAGHAAQIATLAYDPTGHYLLSCAKDGTARVWDTTAPPERILDASLGPISVLGFTAGGQIFAGDQGGKLALWRDPEAGTPAVIDLKHSPLTAMQTDHGAQLLAAAALGKGVLWSVASNRQIAEMPNIGVFVSSLSVSPDGTSVLATGSNSDAVLLDGKTGAVRGTFHTPGTALQFVDGGMSADGKLAWLRAGPKIWLKRADNFAAVHTIDDPSWAWKALIGADDKTLLGVNLDGSVDLWDIASGRSLGQLHAKGAAPQVFAQSADGTRAAVVDKAGVLTVYDLALKRALGSITVPGHTAKSAVMTRDGSVIAVQLGDGSVEVWSVPRFEPLLSLPEEWIGTAASFSPPMAFSPDGKELALRWHNTQLRLWHVDDSLRALVARADKAVPRRLTAAERKQLIISFN